MIGETVSHYRIEEKLGEGGMGVVYRARDLRLDRPVALKFLPPHLVADPRAKNRFLQEARAASALDHPNICVIHEIDETEGGELFIAMAHYAGDTLAQKLQGGALPVQDAVEIACQVAQGLGKAHELGLVHRDVKPGNLMVTDEGLVKILDFGIAKLGGATAMTRTGGVVGTVAYMAPEQAERGESSPQSDVWSLGVVLYEMLTGRVPFQGATPVATLYQLLHAEPDSLAELRSDISPALEGIVGRALAKPVGERYGGMGELLADLESLAGLAATTVVSAAAVPPEPGPTRKAGTPPPFLTPESEPSEETELPPFVGREQELQVLEGWLEEALAGRGRVGFITGEAGTGKTALAREFGRKAAELDESLVLATGSCNAHTGTGDSHRPFREILGQLTGDVEAQWAAGSVSAEHATRLWSLLPTTTEALVERGPDLVGTFLMEVDLLGRARAHPFLKPGRLDDLRTLADRQAKAGALRKADLFEQYVRVLRSLARERPLVLVIDDLQWADEGSIRLLFELAHRLGGARIVVLGLYRTTEVALGRDGERHPLEPVVNELAGVFGEVVLEVGVSGDRDFVDALVDAEANELSPEFRERLFQQARGHALFTVELLRRLREEGLLAQDETRGWVEGATPIDWERLPARVDAVIGERIGRLPPELQELLSLASVEGERFTLEALARVRGTDPSRLLTAVNRDLGRRHQLVAPEGLRRVNGERLSVYRFRHILFQRHLYQRLNEIERTHLHEQVGEALEELYRDQAEEIALELAHHFREADRLEKASEYFLHAGDQARRSLAPADALAHFEAGLEALRSLPLSDERDRLEYQLQMGVGHMRQALPAPGPGEAYSRALELTERVGTTEERFWATYGLYWVAHYEGKYDRFYPLTQRCLALARETGDPTLLLSGLGLAGHGAHYCCDYPSAIAHFEELLGRYELGQRWLPFFAGVDVGVSALMLLGIALFKTGFPVQGFQRLREAVAYARDAKDPVTLQLVLCMGSWPLEAAHDFATGRDWAEESARVQAESGEYGYVLTWPLVVKGWCDVMLGRAEEGLAALGEAMQKGRQFAYTRALHAMALNVAGRGDEGRAALEEAMSIPENHTPYMKARALCLYGDLLATLPEPEPQGAEAAYREAIDIARQQEARSDELNATTSLARLLRDAGRSEEAREMLADIYGWFTEGHDLPYLVEARELLEELGG